MKIILKDRNSKHNIRIWAPISALSFIIRRAAKENANISKKQIRILIKALRKIRKDFKHLELVRIESEDANVLIQL